MDILMTMGGRRVSYLPPLDRIAARKGIAKLSMG